MTDIGAGFFQFPGQAATGAAAEAASAATAMHSQTAVGPHPSDDSAGSNATPATGTTPASPTPDGGAVSISLNSGGGGLWYRDGGMGDDLSLDPYGDGADGVITHIAAKASGSCPYMRELLGLPPLASLAAAAAGGAVATDGTATPPLRPNGLNDSFANGSESVSHTNSPGRGASLSLPPNHGPSYHGASAAPQGSTSLVGIGMATLLPPNHPAVAATPANAMGCPFLSGKRGGAADTNNNTSSINNNKTAASVAPGTVAATAASSAGVVGNGAASSEQQQPIGRCPITGKSGPLPKGHPMPSASASAPPQQQSSTTAAPLPFGGNTAAMSAAAAAGCPFAAKAARAAAQESAVEDGLGLGPAPFSLDGPSAATSAGAVVNSSAVSNMAVVALSVPDTVTANASAIHRCPFINVFANHIDSFIHRALMTSVLNRITLKSFLREKKVLQKFAINSAMFGGGGGNSGGALPGMGASRRGGAAAITAAGDDGGALILATEEAADDEVDESVDNVFVLPADEAEARCEAVLQKYVANGTARPRHGPTAAATEEGGGGVAEEKGDDKRSAVVSSAAAPKLTPAVAAILAAAAANAAHLPPAHQHPKPQPLLNGTGAAETARAPTPNPQSTPAPATPTDGAAPNSNTNSRPQSNASTPSMRPLRRLGEVAEEKDATAGATPSAVASMLSSMRLGKEVSLPMGLSFLNQSTTRANERFTDMYLRVVSEACGIKSGTTPPLRPPARLLGPDGQPNPAALMVMVPSSSLLSRVLGEGQRSVAANASTDAQPSAAVPNVPSDAKAAEATESSAQPPAVALLQPLKASAAAPPKTFLHDVLASLFVPRMRHFYALWLHAVEALEDLVEAREDEQEEEDGANSEKEKEALDENKEDVALADARHRVEDTADDLVHCLRCYARMLHYHIMDPSTGMRLVIEDLIAKANAFVASQTERAKVRRLRRLQREQQQKQKGSESATGTGGGEGGTRSAPPAASAIHVYPAAHRFFAMATIFAIRESVPFRALVAMETGDGAALREAVVAELIRGDKMLQMGDFVEFGTNANSHTSSFCEASREDSNSKSDSASASTSAVGGRRQNVAPLYAHPSSARHVIKAALYTTALATISPVTTTVHTAAAAPNGNNGRAQPQQQQAVTTADAASNASPVAREAGSAKTAAAQQQQQQQGGKKEPKQQQQQTAPAKGSSAGNAKATTKPSDSTNPSQSQQRGGGGGAAVNGPPTSTPLAANAAPFCPVSPLGGKSGSPYPSASSLPAAARAQQQQQQQHMRVGGPAPYQQQQQQQQMGGMRGPHIIQQHQQQTFAMHQQHQQQPHFIPSSSGGSMAGQPFAHMAPHQHQHQQQMMMVAPFVTVPMNDATTPVMVPFAPFLQYQQHMSNQQQMQQQQHQQQHQMAMAQQQQQQQVQPQQQQQSATSLIAAHYAAMQEANRLRNPNNANSNANGNANNGTANALGGSLNLSAASGSGTNNGSQSFGGGTAAPQPLRSQVPPFYTTPNADLPAGGVSAVVVNGGVPVAFSGAATTAADGTGSQRYADPSSGTFPSAAAMPNGHAATSAAGGGDAAALAKCPFLRSQFPSGVPAIIPTNGGSGRGSGIPSSAGTPTNGGSGAVPQYRAPPPMPSDPASASAPSAHAQPFFPAGGAASQPHHQQSAAFGYSPTASTAAAPFFPLYYPVVNSRSNNNGVANGAAGPSPAAAFGGGAFGGGGGFAQLTPEEQKAVAAVEELIAPVYQPKKGNGIALRPPPYGTSPPN